MECGHRKHGRWEQVGRMAAVEVRHWDSNFVILVHQPHSEGDLLEIGRASFVNDGFGFVAEAVASEAATRALAQVVHERVHSM